MNRSSLLIAGVALICGVLLGLGGAVAYIGFREPPASEAMAQDDPLPEVQAVLLPAVDDAERLSNGAIALEIEAPGPQIVVEVNGAVQLPGVYTLHEGARVRDGIAAAGDIVAGADMSDINIAARLVDNTSLYIPFQMLQRQDEQVLVARRTPRAAATNPARYTRSGWAHGAPDTPGVDPAIYPGAAATNAGETHQTPGSDNAVQAGTGNDGASGLIDLNRASLAELQQLPGIGPVLSESIDAYRQRQPFRSVDELMSVHGIGPKRFEAVQQLVTVQ